MNHYNKYCIIIFHYFLFMNIVPLTFEQFSSVWDWKEIPNCPGRFTMHPQKTISSSVKDFMIRTNEDVSGILNEWNINDWTKVWPAGEVVRNVLWVARLENDCGIISYEHPSGGFLHTLNNASGFERKLKALHIYDKIYIS